MKIPFLSSFSFQAEYMIGIVLGKYFKFSKGLVDSTFDRILPGRNSVDNAKIDCRYQYLDAAQQFAYFGGDVICVNW